MRPVIFSGLRVCDTARHKKTPRFSWGVWLRESYGCANFTNPQNPLDIRECAPGREETMDRIRTFSEPVSPQRGLRWEVSQCSLYAKPSDHKAFSTYHDGDGPSVRRAPGFRRVQVKNRDRQAVRSEQSQRRAVKDVVPMRSSPGFGTARHRRHRLPSEARRTS
jgi:hypothetical protein